MTEGIASSTTGPVQGVLGARLWWITPILAGLLVAALAELSIDEASIQPQEAELVAAAQSSVGAIWETARIEDMTHLTTHLLWKPWLALAGTSEEAARIPSLLFAALAAGVAVLLGREIGGWLAGAVAGAVLATNGYVLQASVTADGTTLALFLAVLATLALVRAARGDNPVWWALYALSAVATATVDLASTAIVAAHVAYVALLRPLRWTRATVAFGAVAVALAAYLALVSRSAAWALDWLDDPSGRAIAETLWEVTGRNPVAVAAGIAGLVAVGAGWTQVRALPGFGLLGPWLVAPLVAVLAVSLWRPAFTADALVTITPALALLCGLAVAAAMRIEIVAGAVALALGAGAVASVWQRLREETPADWRRVTAYVVETRGAGDDVLVVPARQRAAFAYYADDVPVAAAPASGAVWVVAAAADDDRALVEGREAVGAPAYALLAGQRFDGGLMVQHWVRP